VQQIHKIPGTTYAQGNLAPSGSSSPSWNEQGEISGDSVGGGSTAGDATFKAKMESLHDPMSTNLYMEGSVLALRNIWTAYIYIFLFVLLQITIEY
jgi:hypothetical protein